MSSKEAQGTIAEGCPVKHSSTEGCPVKHDGKQHDHYNVAANDFVFDQKPDSNQKVNLSTTRTISNIPKVS